MKRTQLPKKEKQALIPLLCIHIDRGFEDEILNTAIRYRQKEFIQEHEGKLFRTALQTHIRDSNFPHILKAPNPRLLMALREQWLEKPDFCLLVLWLWKQNNQAYLQQASAWLAQMQPEAQRIYADDPDAPATSVDIENRLADWAQGFAPQEEGPGQAVFAVALSLYEANNPDLFRKFEAQQPTTSGTGTKNEVSTMAQTEKGPWKNLLKQLEREKPERLEMGEFEGFVEQARAIVQGKINEGAQARKREAFLARLQELMAALGPWESYSDSTRHRDWSVERIGLEEGEAFLQKSQELQAHLGEWADLRKVQPKRDEKPAHERRINEAEAAIDTLYGELDRLLGVEVEPASGGQLPTETEALPVPPPEVKAEVIAEAPSSPTPEPAPVEESRPADAIPTTQPEESLEPQRPPSAQIPQEETETGPQPEEQVWEPSGETLEADAAPEGSDSLDESMEADAALSRETEEPQPEPPVSPELPDYGSVTGEEIGRCMLGDLDRQDFSHACWVARAAEQQGRQALLPAWLIAGLQGLHWWLESGASPSARLLAELREIANPQEHMLESAHAVHGLSLAVGLGLLDGGAAWEQWLDAEIPPSAPNLDRLLNEIDSFVRTGSKLDPALVRGVLGKEQLEADTKKFAANAKDWIKTAPQKGARFPGADEVWKAIVGSKGTLHDWFDLAAQDQRKSYGKVLEELEHWSSRAWLDNYIQKLFRERHGNAKSIDGGARDQLIGWLQNAAELAGKWAGNVDAANRIADQKNWNWKQTTDLCSFLKENLPNSIQETRALAAGALPLDHIGWKLLGITLELLQASLGLAAANPLPGAYADTLSLEENLTASLFLFPELQLKDNGLPAAQFSAQDLSALVKAQHSPLEAFDLWLARRNYWFLDALIARMPQAEQDSSRRKMFEQHNLDVHWLALEVDRTTVAVEQALFDDLITDQNYVASRSRVESIKKQLRLSGSGAETSDRLNFQALFNELRGSQQEFETSRDDRLAKYRRHWEELQAGLPKWILGDEERSQFVSMVERSFGHKDLRAVTEAIVYLESGSADSEKLTPDLFARQQVTYKVKDFNARLVNLHRRLEIQSLLTVGESLMHNLPAPRSREVQVGLEAWSRIKPDVNRNLREEIFPQLTAILQYLGLDLSAESPISLIAQASAGFQHWHISAAPRAASPVPQFGSNRLRGGSGKMGLYDVVGAWGRPSFDAIEAFLNHIGKEPLILLYFGRMLPSQRMDLMRLARKKQLPLLVVDDLLMAFLAGEYNVRLSAMFECALPYSSINPYTPFATGSVPPEMFFGRQDRIDSLKDLHGPCLVYGGRQLGKSALLRQVQRQFHNPERAQFALYEDIRLIGDPFSKKDYSTALAERLTEAFRNERILAPTRPVPDLDKLADLLIQQINSNGWRVLLLLDEADMFLEADAGRRFTAVTTLKRVMDQTNRMFKVVFAGLHQVQRFTHTSNQPLAHLGGTSAIRVGPLEPHPAIDLIEKPLRSLGYVFGKPGEEDRSLILHILSYTNYHPGLLQLFGQSLVDHLNKKPRGSAQPPYSIARSDIDAVYRTAKVRETIKDRFDITLGLDERYEAIALSLILEQWDEKNGFDRLFTPQELLGMVRTHWSAGFEEDITIFKGLLDEMCGLGVLSSVSSRNENDRDQAHGDTARYQLRSPNLVSLMGTEAEIFNRLDVISRSQPESPQRKLESYHAPIESYYSPLTYAQERVLLDSASGVCMVFGTQATRINNLPETLKMTTETNGCWEEIKVAANTEATLLDQLRGLPRNKGRLTVAYRELDGTPEQMEQQVIAAARFCGQSRSDRLRVIFSLNSLTAWNWFQIPAERRQKIEQDYVDVIVSLNRWDQLGIRQLLEQHDPEIPVGKTAIRRAFEVTGGWPNLMDDFIDRCRGKNDPLLVLDAQNASLDEDPTRADFIADLGLYDNRLLNGFLDIVLNEADLESLTDEDALVYLFSEKDPEQAKVILEYLRRLSVALPGPALKIEPVVARLWHVPAV